jgi:hypothetical protein
MLPCTHCGRHHLPDREECPHCSRRVNSQSLSTGAIVLGLILASSACDGGNDKAVALYGAAYYPDTGDTGDTAEDPEDDQP